MPETTHVQTNFTSGEISPRLIGRSDLNQYQNGAATIENFITQKHGGLIRRTGSRYVANTKNNGPARLIRFQFSVVQTYQLEFGANYIRIYRDKGRLQHGAASTVSAATWASNVATITTTSNHGLDAGDTVNIAGTITDYVPNPSRFDGVFIVLSVTSNTAFTYTLLTDPLDGGGSTWQSGGTVVKTVGANRGVATEIVTTYTAAQLSRVKFTQSADILYLTHPDHVPRTLSRTLGGDADPATWTLAEFTTTDGPYLSINTVEGADWTIDEITGGGGGAGATVTVFASAEARLTMNGGLGFSSNDVGRIITWQVLPGAEWSWATVTTVTDESTVVATMVTPTAIAVSTDSWRLGAWSIETGFPRCLTFHKSRLWFGATTAQPQTLWASRVGDFTNFVDFDRGGGDDAGTVVADHAITHTIDDDRVNTIHFIKSEARGIAILTNGGAFIGSAPTAYDPVTPTNFTITRQLSDGASETVEPHQASEVILFVKDAERKVLEFVFKFTDDRFVAPDLTILSEHITLSGLIESAYQSEPDNIFWGARDDGQLVGMTYERKEEVIAWHRHLMGGELDTASPEVESVSIIRDGTDDLLWLVVKRTIDGATVRFVEYVGALFEDDEKAEDAFYVDAGLTYSIPIAISRIGSLTAGVPEYDNPVVGDAMVIETATPHGLSGLDNTIRIRGVEGAVNAAALNDKSVMVEQFLTPTEFGFGFDPITGTPIQLYVSDDYVAGTGFVHLEVTSIGGLSHLAGESVKILADGKVIPNQTVTAGGGITLADKASIVHIGLGFTSRVKTLPLVPRQSARQADPRGTTMRVDTVYLYLNRTIGGLAGSDIGIDKIVTRIPSDVMGQATPLFTGVYKLALPQRAGEQPQVIVEISDPTPLNLLSIVSKMQTNEV